MAKPKIVYTESKFNLATPIVGIAGEPFYKGPKEDDVVLKFADVATEALLSVQIQGEKAPEKFRRYALAKKIFENQGSEVVLDRAERDLIKLCVGQFYMPAVMGPVWELLG